LFGQAAAGAEAFAGSDDESGGAHRRLLGRQECGWKRNLCFA
jgi:hypothetical protein